MELEKTRRWVDGGTLCGSREKTASTLELYEPGLTGVSVWVG